MEDIEDVLYEVVKERVVDLEKEEREEDLEDCEEVGGLLRGGGEMFVINLVVDYWGIGERCLWYM